MLFYIIRMIKMNESVFQNSILDKKLKEKLTDAALYLLINNKFIEMKKNSLKIITLKKLYKLEKVYHFATQDGKLLLLNEKFIEETFLETKRGMFARYNVNAALEKLDSYKMELY